MNVLVTGANGFVGRSLCRSLVDAGHHVSAVTRQPHASRPVPSHIKFFPMGEIGPDTDWGTALMGIDVVMHLAARVHIMNRSSATSLDAYRRVNTAGTERLAREASRLGVRRFVYVSTIKVNGESTSGNAYSDDKGGVRRYSESDITNPCDPYAVSKWEAEQALHAITAETNLQIAILRPPLVYGPGVGGNFLRLLKWINQGVPLPLASIRNRRSLIYLENLVDVLLVCGLHPAAAGKTFLLSDGEDVSTPELIEHLARAMSRPAHLFPFPLFLLHLAGKVSGMSAEISRLTDSLLIDGSRIRRDLNWTPPFSMLHGLKRTVEQYCGESPIKK